MAGIQNFCPIVMRPFFIPMKCNKIQYPNESNFFELKIILNCIWEFFYTPRIIFLLIYLSKMPHNVSTKFGNSGHSAEKTPQASTWPTSSKMSCYQTTISQTKNIQRAKKGQI